MFRAGFPETGLIGGINGEVFAAHEARQEFGLEGLACRSVSSASVPGLIDGVAVPPDVVEGMVGIVAPYVRAVASGNGIGPHHAVGEADGVFQRHSHFKRQIVERSAVFPPGFPSPVFIIIIPPPGRVIAFVIIVVLFHFVRGMHIAHLGERRDTEGPGDFVAPCGRQRDVPGFRIPCGVFVVHAVVGAFVVGIAESHIHGQKKMGFSSGLPVQGSVNVDHHRILVKFVAFQKSGGMVRHFLDVLGTGHEAQGQAEQPSPSTFGCAVVIAQGSAAGRIVEGGMLVPDTGISEASHAAEPETRFFAVLKTVHAHLGVDGVRKGLHVARSRPEGIQSGFRAAVRELVDGLGVQQGGTPGGAQTPCI